MASHQTHLKWDANQIKMKNKSIYSSICAGTIVLYVRKKGTLNREHQHFLSHRIESNLSPDATHLSRLIKFRPSSWWCEVLKFELFFVSTPSHSLSHTRFGFFFVKNPLEILFTLCITFSLVKNFFHEGKMWSAIILVNPKLRNSIPMNTLKFQKYIRHFCYTMNIQMGMASYHVMFF